MRLQELAFRWGNTHYRAALSGPQHCVVAPPELPLRALRDAICAVFYGADHFAGGARGGLRNAGVRFEVNGILYKVMVDLTTGRRVLLQMGGAQPETIADTPGTISQALTALLHLPSAIVFRSLSLSQVEFPEVRFPRVPAGAQRAVLAHAQQPETLLGEVDAARAQVEVARLQARRGLVSPPWRTPLATVPALLALLTLVLALFGTGAVSMVGLATPVLLGVAAWRALRWIDATEQRSNGLRALDEAESVARARRRQLDEIETHLSAIERATGSRAVEVVTHVFAATQDQSAPPELQDLVEAYVGDVPQAEVVGPLVAAFGVPGVASASAGLVLAAARARRGRAAPLIWVAEGEGSRTITWDRVFELLDDDTPLLVFRNTPTVSGERGVLLQPVNSAEGSGG